MSPFFAAFFTLGKFVYNVYSSCLSRAYVMQLLPYGLVGGTRGFLDKPHSSTTMIDVFTPIAFPGSVNVVFLRKNYTTH